MALSLSKGRRIAHHSVHLEDPDWDWRLFGRCRVNGCSVALRVAGSDWLELQDQKAGEQEGDDQRDHAGGGGSGGGLEVADSIRSDESAEVADRVD